MRILITGNMGYVGPVVAAHFRSVWPDAELIGFDSGYFAQCLTLPDEFPERVLDKQVFGDVRDFPTELLEGIDAVVHLAALSNDPIGARFEKQTEGINYRASIDIAQAAAEAGVKSFVFASSCSVYGIAEGGPRKETDTLTPLTAYARSKIATEQALEQLEAPKMAITCLRFATACGQSPRLRLDLVLNDFVATALATGEIRVLSDGTPWRPLIDVKDMARAMEWAIKRDSDDDGRFVSINAGRNENNYQVFQLAEAVAEAIPGTRVSINTNAPPDQRSYQVDFTRFAKVAPDHQPSVSLSESIGRLVDGLTSAKQAGREVVPAAAKRLTTLERLMDAGRLSDDVRWMN
ncbi:NAD-dependent epimerase/dehydratase [Agrobacterium sp.]|jgi:nucleoside-diphosphate-sugar epimerase|uniref:NAD-dependent epimerase/dehydratase family protein n=1 Tax=Agrobacterium sp. TaxID=361 RepID=UPI0028A949DF|nr:NAD-dependent epimerase/dehydratase [Agrobacterium sp.]